jgi:hypothetical protein
MRASICSSVKRMRSMPEDERDAHAGTGRAARPYLKTRLLFDGGRKQAGYNKNAANKSVDNKVVGI